MVGCHICGQPVIVYRTEATAICPEHCEDHDYRYERGDGHMCLHCGVQPPDDWFDVDLEMAFDAAMRACLR